MTAFIDDHRDVYGVEDQRRLVDKCPGNCNALEFAAGEIAGIALAAITETDGGEHPVGPGLDRHAISRNHRQRKGDVLAKR